MKDKDAKLSKNVLSIKYLVEANGYKGSSFSRAAGFGNSIYYQWMKGTKEPKLETLYMIADFFKVKFNDYFERPCLDDDPIVKEKSSGYESNPLTFEEVQMIYNYRKLDLKAKRIISSILSILNENENDTIEASRKFTSLKEQSIRKESSTQANFNNNNTLSE